MKEFVYTIRGVRTFVKAKKVGSVLWLHVNGETYAIDTQSKQRKNTQGSNFSEGNGELLSPMPGKILKINTSLGCEVKKGSTIISIEAMKMEYALVAPFDGIVAKLNCKEGQQVEFNQLLAIVEKRAK